MGGKIPAKGRSLAAFKKLFRRFSPDLRARGAALKSFASKIGLVYFGSVHQVEDDHDMIRGFTASLKHKDTHFAVGTYDGYNVRLVNRFDVVRLAGTPYHEQIWTILEVDLETKSHPHVYFIPTGREAGEYGRIFATQPLAQPINTLITHNKSPEFHGRFNIVANPTYAHQIESVFPSPIIAGIAARFWPHGIEVQNGKLLVYITEHRLEKAVLESTLASALWLAEAINDTTED